MLSVTLTYSFVPSLNTTFLPAKGTPSEVKVTFKDSPAPFLNVVGLVTVISESLIGTATTSICTDAEQGDISPSPANWK